MDLFSISQISQFTGVKPNTIRAWERRYDAVKPNRSEGNTRYYSNSQLRRLLNIVSLREDYQISKLCSYSDEKLFELIVSQQQNGSSNESDNYFISQLIAAVIDYDEANFAKVLAHCLLRYSMKEAYIKVICPMLERLGLMWTSNNLHPACEHFISNLIRQKLLTAIDSLPPSSARSDVWVLFLPENEFHDIGLLLANYLIRLSGQKVIFLGANVPMQSLKSAHKVVEPDHLLFFFVRNNLAEHSQEYLNQLHTSFPNRDLFLSGNDKLINQLQLNEKMHWLRSVDEFAKQLKL